jgi:hypothetical protein
MHGEADEAAGIVEDHRFIGEYMGGLEGLREKTRGLLVIHVT